ncbi:hemolysin family protein [Nocardiopsis sp. MG754419]|uniref:hemolysin family protein n=1 Tax=Nocardiopsis sp. MG754419 TaxID=2259865 RepID=UPI001BA9B614|nr:hemolysin family protein [Nocardiopsis sp. MG754419]MBR8745055.1 HlyC/CorC family transporter [Nocardiopsis sp. MG754419]
MEGYGAQIGLVLVLVVVNAVFAGSEIALVTLREGQIRRLEERGPGGRAVARLARDPNRFLATIQIGITLAGFLASATAAVALARPLVEPLGFLGRYAAPVSIVLVTIVLTFVTLVLGELAPKRIAMQRAEGWALLVARPLDLLAALTRPVVWLLGASTDVVVRLLGADPRAEREEVTEEELREMITSRGDMTPEQRQILDGAFEIRERRLREVLVPRRDVDAVSSGTGAARALARLAERGHSRAPVVRFGDLDEVVGVVHWSDLIGRDEDVADLAREVPRLPDTLSLSVALRRMTEGRQQLAMVIGESGEVGGIVSLEDLLEELVGDITDETDRDRPEVVRLAGGALRLPGAFPVHDLLDLGVELTDRPNGAYVTVAGMVLVLLGRIPDGPGDRVDLGGWSATVLAADGRRIDEIRLNPEPVTE